MSVYMQRAMLRELRKERIHVPAARKMVDAPAAKPAFDAAAYVRRVQSATHHLLACARQPPNDLGVAFIEHCAELSRQQFIECYRCFRVLTEHSDGRPYRAQGWNVVFENAVRRKLAEPEPETVDGYLLSAELVPENLHMWVEAMRAGKRKTPEDD